MPVPDVLTWAQWFETAKDERIVARTDLRVGGYVSTVFLGLDHSFFGDGPRQLFETLVFDGPHDGAGCRYATWAQAEAGHQALVKAYGGAAKVPK